MIAKMVFSEKKFPVLKNCALLKSGGAAKIYIGVDSPVRDKNKESTSNERIAELSGKILMECNPMWFTREISTKICRKEFSFLKSIRQFIENCDISGCGLILCPILTYPSKKSDIISLEGFSIGYLFYTDNDGFKWFEVIGVLGDDLICFYTVGFIAPGEGKINIVPLYPSKQIMAFDDRAVILNSFLEYLDTYFDGLGRRFFLDYCLHHHIFKNFAPIETVIVPPGSRKVIAGNEKQMNTGSVPVLHIDSKWFRNIIRSEGFSVRGHFRLQPKKKDGEWTHELIWINDFEKHGYHSKARILNEQN